MIMIIKDDDNNNNGEDISTVIILNLQLTEIYYYDVKWFVQLWLEMITTRWNN